VLALADFHFSVDTTSMNNSTIIGPQETISIAPEPKVEDDPDDDSPYFIKPSGFRPNALFVGMSKFDIYLAPIFLMFHNA